MKYSEYRISGIPNETASDIIVAELAELGFDSFSEYNPADQSVCAYIPEPEEEKYAREITDLLTDATYEYDIRQIKDDTNWNSVWESNFEPITVDDRCYIRAPFHDRRPDVTYEIEIMPKMSFGTGHHATTHLMIENMLDIDLKGKIVLDMGSGTGVLAILAALKGAAEAHAIDVDRWAYENCRENVEANHVEGIVNVRLGDASLLKYPEKYDTVLANINRNILLEDMDKYAAVLKTGGSILLSGILEIDVACVAEKAKSVGLIPKNRAVRNGWAFIGCVKI